MGLSMLWGVNLLSVFMECAPENLHNANYLENVFQYVFSFGTDFGVFERCGQKSELLLGQSYT